MSHYVYYGNLVVTELNSYTIKFIMKNIGGLAVSGITNFNVIRSKAEEFPAVVQAVVTTGSPGPHGTPPSIVEIDPANMPGVYEFKGAMVDVDTKGPTAWIFERTAGPVAEETLVIVPHLLRQSVLDA